jgi:hypothetical protein
MVRRQTDLITDLTVPPNRSRPHNPHIADFFFFFLPLQAKTPQQRKANERYAKLESSKRGKPESAIKQKPKFKAPISVGLVGEFVPS